MTARRSRIEPTATSEVSIDNLIDLIQTHERTWGTESYPERPTLAELLNAPVVAWWRSTKADDTRLRASVYQTLDDLDAYLTRVLIHSRLEMPTHRLALIFINQKRAAVRGVRVQITAIEDEG
ncbi:MAG: hypothetical protein SF029_26885 [bacterium]|nr:hypothetical protein [bacterium]